MKKFLKISLLIFAVFFVTHEASASVLYSQLDSSTSEDFNSSGQSPRQLLGTGLSGVVTDISFYASSTYSGQQVIVYLACYEDSSYVQNCTNNPRAHTDTVLITETKTKYTQPITFIFDGSNDIFATSYTLNPSKYYSLSVNKTVSAQNYTNYGLYSDISSGTCFKSSGVLCSSIDKIYYELSGQEVDKIDHTSPSSGSTTSAYITFTGTYNNLTGVYDTVIILLDDLTHSSAPLLTIICDTAQTGTSINYNCSHSGVVNTNYQYTAILWDSSQTFPSGTLQDVSGVINFATNDTYEIPPLGNNTCETFDVGCYVVNGIKYLFYPTDIASNKLNELIDSIKNKPPIGYISGVITGLGAIDINATPTLTFASFTPVSNYIFTPLRTGLAWVLWIAFMFLLFKRFQHFEL